MSGGSPLVAGAVVVAIVLAGLWAAPQIVDQLEEWLGPEDVEDDLGGNVTYHDIPHAYIVTGSGTSYRSTNAVTGEVVASGSNAFTVITTTLNALTPGRTSLEAVLLKGTFALNDGITVDGNTVVQLDGTVAMSSGSTDSILSAEGEDGVIVDGGSWYGSAAAIAPFYFEGCTGVEVLAEVHDSAGAEPVEFDYAIAGSVVLDDSYVDAHTANSVTDALKWATAKAGATVYVPSGQYEIADAVTTFADGTALTGDGPDQTVFEFTSSWYQQDRSHFGPTNVGNVTLEEFSITGQGAIEFHNTAGVMSNIAVEDVTIHDTDNLYNHAFAVMVDIGCEVDGVRFTRCIADNVGGDGFDLWGETWGQSIGDLRTSGGWIRNVSFDSCQALYCGFTKQSWDWTVGFDLAEEVNVDNVTLDDCEASYNWESGFHIEANPIANGVVYTNCVANYNGQKYSDPRGAAYGKGFLNAPEILVGENPSYPYGIGSTPTLIGCSGTGNAGGYGMDCVALYDYYETAYTYKVANATVVNATDVAVHTAASFTEALQWACAHFDAYVYVPAGTYNVTGRVTLASGVTLYGQADYHLTLTEKTVFSFPGASADEGFLISSSDTSLHQVRVLGGNVVIDAGSGAITGTALKGVTFSGTGALHAAAIEMDAGTGAISGTVLYDVNALAAVDGCKLTGSAASPTRVLCSGVDDT